VKLYVRNNAGEYIEQTQHLSCSWLPGKKLLSRQRLSLLKSKKFFRTFHGEGDGFSKWGGTPTLLHGQSFFLVQTASQKLVFFAHFLDVLVKKSPWSFFQAIRMGRLNVFL
jgi:hypothetical protein